MRARRRRRRGSRRSRHIGRLTRSTAPRACVRRTVSASSIRQVDVLVTCAASDSRGFRGGAECGKRASYPAVCSIERHGHARPSHVPHRIASHPSHLLRMQSAVIHRTYLQHARSRSSDSHEPHMPHPTSHRVASHRIASKRIVHRVREHPSTPECTPDAPNRGDSWYIVTHEPLPRAFDDFRHHAIRTRCSLRSLKRSRRRARRLFRSERMSTRHPCRTRPNRLEVAQIGIHDRFSCFFRASKACRSRKPRRCAHLDTSRASLLAPRATTDECCKYS